MTLQANRYKEEATVVLTPRKYQSRSACASAVAHAGSLGRVSPPRSTGEASCLPPPSRKAAGGRFQAVERHVGVNRGLSSTSNRTLLRGRGTCPPSLANA